MKCVYIYNPNSGKMKNGKKSNYIVERLKQKFNELEVKPTGKRGDAGEFAKAACGNCDVLVVAGGDGTLNEVINAIAPCKIRPTIGYIPTGTANDLAHSLKIPKNIKKALNIIMEGKSIMHDVFKAGQHYGIYVCGFGVFTSCSYNAAQKYKKHFGRIAYAANGAKEMFTGKPFKLTLTSLTSTITGKFVLGLIVNSRYVAGFKINKMACCNDGFVNVVLVRTNAKRHFSLASLLRVFRVFLFGINSLSHNKKCVILKLNKFKVDVENNITINLDGEKGFNGAFDFEVLQSHVQIMVK